jgi:hypothetical protein
VAKKKLDLLQLATSGAALCRMDYAESMHVTAGSRSV